MIDGGLFLGRNPTNGNCLQKNELIPFMDRFSIAKGLVAHYKSIFYDFKEGNRELLEMYKDYPDRIIPVVILSKNGIDVFRDENYLSYLRESGARVLGIYLLPKYYDIYLESYLLRSIAKNAVEKGFVLQFGLQNVEDLYKVIDYYGDLKSPLLIRWMSGSGYKNLAEILHTLKRFSNFYFDIGSLVNSGAIRYLVDCVGTERLYYSSNIPESFSLTSHFLIQSASLNRKEKEQIFSNTLGALFSFDKKQKQCIQMDSIEQSWRFILEKPKIDVHFHINGWNVLGPETNINNFNKEFEIFNYKKVIFSSSEALNYDLFVGNKQTMDLIETDPRFYGLIVIDPTRVEDSLAEIEKYANHKKFVGLKTIQDLYGYRLDHSSYCIIFEKNKKIKLPVMGHILGMLEVSKMFPEFNFICAHSTWERVKHMLGNENIYFDLATSHNDVAETKMEKFIHEAGNEKILFASDAQLINPAWTLGKLASSEIREDSLEKILFFNALKAFPKLN